MRLRGALRGPGSATLSQTDTPNFYRLLRDQASEDLKRCGFVCVRRHFARAPEAPYRIIRFNPAGEVYLVRSVNSCGDFSLR